VKRRLRVGRVERSPHHESRRESRILIGGTRSTRPTLRIRPPYDLPRLPARRPIGRNNMRTRNLLLLFARRAWACFSLVRLRRSPCRTRSLITHFLGDDLTMNVWQGQYISFLTPTTRTGLDNVTMASIVTKRPIKAYQYYNLATGLNPNPYPPYYYINGRDTIAAVDNTGGAGYSWIGSTGNRVADRLFNTLYNGVEEQQPIRPGGVLRTRPQLLAVRQSA